MIQICSTAGSLQESFFTHPQEMAMDKDLWQSDLSRSQSCLEIHAVVHTHKHISLVHSI